MRSQCRIFERQTLWYVKLAVGSERLKEQFIQCWYQHKLKL